MPWRTLCGFPPTSDTVTLRVPNGAWRPDTVITDYEGTEMFVLLDQIQEMRSYEAVFGDLEGRRLVCIKRHMIKAFWKDGYYFCTYKPNYKGQLPLAERDIENKKVYPFSYLQVSPMKGRFFYRYFDNQEGLSAPKMRADNPWLGFMVVCCTPMVRCGKWTASFKRRSLNAPPTIHVDQWRNCVDVGPGNDLLAALCMAYVFDRYQCQPLVTVFGVDDEEDGDVRDEKSIDTHDGPDPLAGIGDYGPPTTYQDAPYDPNNNTGEYYNDPNYAGQYYDENGQPVQYYDENGQPMTTADGGQQYYDENGQPVDGQHYDENGQFVGGQQYYDENGQPMDNQYYDDGQGGGQYYDDGQGGQYYDDGQGGGQHYDDDGQGGGQYYDDGQGGQYYDDGQGGQYYDDGEQQYNTNGQGQQQQQPPDLLDNHDEHPKTIV